MSLPSLLAVLIGQSRRRAPAFLLGGLLLAALAVWYGIGHLGISTDTDALFSASLPWRQREIAWERSFPQTKSLLVAVVDAPVPEVADQTAADLAAALARDPARFRDVTRPDASPYLTRNALLFLDPKALGALLDRIIDAQPFLGQLVADPSARGLFGALALLATGVEHGQAELAPFAAPLRAFHTALAAAAAGHPVPLSWESLLAGRLAQQAGPYRFVLTHPALDYAALQPGGAATAAMRVAIAGLPYVRDGEAHVRITGSVALEDEEFATVAQGMAVGILASIALITLWLVLALRSWRLIVPVLLTLVLGLALTLGFAAVAVGTLNLVSLAFAILFVGIAVDFAIQVSVRFREHLFAEADPARALDVVARVVGPEVLVAAAATACGFLAFVPSAFVGVSELGLIAGVGMAIAFLCTLLFLPAALTLFRPRPEPASVGLRWGARAEPVLLRARRPVLAVFAVLALAGAALLPRLEFDGDPLHTKNPNTEAMRTLADLANFPQTDPYTIDVLAPSLAAADALAGRIDKLSLVRETLTLSSFVPADQPAKLALIADAASILGATLTQGSPAAPVTAADLRLAAATAGAQIGRVRASLPPDSPLGALAGDLDALAKAPDATLMAANAALTHFLPGLIDQLRTALDAHPVTAADVPADIRRDWLLPDGQARIQVVGRPETHGSRGMHAFVAQVRSVAPEAEGTAVTIVETAATVVSAFRNAALYALAAIALILAITLRRLRDVALVMAPLLLSSMLTVLLIVLAGIKLNFANVIALPLLLGVGVSFNVYFVMNWRSGTTRFLGSSTARAIVFSALTTGSAFGSLALSRHPGTASMGRLLLLSLACTVIATLVFEPALLTGLRRPPSLRQPAPPAPRD